MTAVVCQPYKLVAVISPTGAWIAVHKCLAGHGLDYPLPDLVPRCLLARDWQQWSGTIFLWQQDIGDCATRPKGLTSGVCRRRSWLSTLGRSSCIALQAEASELATCLLCASAYYCIWRSAAHTRLPHFSVYSCGTSLTEWVLSLAHSLYVSCFTSPESRPTKGGSEGGRWSENSGSVRNDFATMHAPRVASCLSDDSSYVTYPSRKLTPHARSLS